MTKKQSETYEETYAVVARILSERACYYSEQQEDEEADAKDRILCAICAERINEIMTRYSTTLSNVIAETGSEMSKFAEEFARVFDEDANHLISIEDASDTKPMPVIVTQYTFHVIGELEKLLRETKREFQILRREMKEVVERRKKPRIAAQGELNENKVDRVATTQQRLREIDEEIEETLKKRGDATTGRRALDSKLKRLRDERIQVMNKLRKAKKRKRNNSQSSPQPSSMPNEQAEDKKKMQEVAYRAEKATQEIRKLVEKIIELARIKEGSPIHNLFDMDGEKSIVESRIEVYTRQWYAERREKNKKRIFSDFQTVFDEVVNDIHLENTTPRQMQKFLNAVERDKIEAVRKMSGYFKEMLINMIDAQYQSAFNEDSYREIQENFITVQKWCEEIREETLNLYNRNLITFAHCFSKFVLNTSFEEVNRSIELAKTTRIQSLLTKNLSISLD